MSQWLGIIILFTLGAGLIVADLFLPSHLMLTVCALGLFAYALFLTFQISVVAGLVGLVLLVVIMVGVMVLFLRVWPRTWVGQQVAPPNPVLGEKDRLPLEDLEPLIGRRGESLTPLRPVGACLFDGRRIECVAERGVIAPNVPVEAIRLVDRTLCVRPVSSSPGIL
ncbi:MAG: hypothetical protein KA354_16790 [Phycisphaerae bacterium]|nr:hypothetical protein [Phycisphaerae bacterium]